MLGRSVFDESAARIAEGKAMAATKAPANKMVREKCFFIVFVMELFVRRLRVCRVPANHTIPTSTGNSMVLLHPDCKPENCCTITTAAPVFEFPIVLRRHDLHSPHPKNREMFLLPPGLGVLKPP